MKKLYVLFYDNKEGFGERLELYPFDEREEEESINEDKTCFIQKVMFHNQDCLKIKVDYGYVAQIRYLPTPRYSIEFVEIFE